MDAPAQENRKRILSFSAFLFCWSHQQIVWCLATLVRTSFLRSSLRSLLIQMTTSLETHSQTHDLAAIWAFLSLVKLTYKSYHNSDCFTSTYSKINHHKYVCIFRTIWWFCVFYIKILSCKYWIAIIFYIFYHVEEIIFYWWVEAFLSFLSAV